MRIALTLALDIDHDHANSEHLLDQQRESNTK